jgi:hypothetical protein
MLKHGGLVVLVEAAPQGVTKSKARASMDMGIVATIASAQPDPNNNGGNGANPINDYAGATTDLAEWARCSSLYLGFCQQP